MTIRQKNLRKILSTKYLENNTITFIDSKDLVKTSFHKYYQEAFELLGGHGAAPDISLKGYFFENVKFSLELDELLFFNRYRLKTLRSEIYNSFPGIKADMQRIYCNKYEKECQKVGSTRQVWTSHQAEKIFGRSEDPGDFGLNGSAGWKLTALENTLKDIYAKYKKIRLLRIAVWDEIMVNKQLVKIGDLLTNPDQKAAEHLLHHIERRVINLFAD